VCSTCFDSENCEAWKRARVRDRGTTRNHANHHTELSLLEVQVAFLGYQNDNIGTVMAIVKLQVRRQFFFDISNGNAKLARGRFCLVGLEVARRNEY
jgi:hypothetical protein